MSIRIITEALHERADGLDPTALLVLIILADNADDKTRLAWPSIPYIARIIGTTRNPVRNALRRLEAAGELTILELGGGRKSGRYEVHPGRGGATQPGERAHPQGGSSYSPRTVIEPTTSGETATALGENGNGNDPHPRSAVVAREAKPRITHNGRTVPESRLDAALGILAAFNAAAGTRQAAFTKAGKPSAGLSRILTAIADYPEVAELGPRMIGAAFRDPWWKGRPQPGNVFGPGVVQRYIDEARLGKPAANPALARFVADAEADVIDSTATETGAP